MLSGCQTRVNRQSGKFGDWQVINVLRNLLKIKLHAVHAIQNT
jgi:hypothetical protein